MIINEADFFLSLKLSSIKPVQFLDVWRPRNTEVVIHPSNDYLCAVGNWHHFVSGNFSGFREVVLLG
jgi:hypothetical protein